MVFENYVFVLSALSSLVLVAGLYYTYILSKLTGKASMVWALIFFAFSALFVYQAAEVLEYYGTLFPHGDETNGILHTSFENFIQMPTGSFAGEVSHAMPSAASAIFLCIVLVVRKSLIVPI